MKISISGMIGSGKSTVSKLLAKRLNYEYYSVGKFMREISIKKGLHLSELSKDAEKGKELDEELDNMQKNLNKEKQNFVMDSRLGFYFIPHSFKIFLKVDLDEACKRIFNESRDEEEYDSLEECKQHIKRRTYSEKIRYKQYYDIDFPDESKFDLIIDTSDISAKEVVDKIMESVKRMDG